MKTKQAPIPGNAYSHAVPDPFITIDEVGIINSCNTEAEMIFGVEPGALLQQSIRDLIQLEQDNSFESEIVPAVRLLGNISIQCSLRNIENSSYTLHFISLLNTRNELIGITVTFSGQPENAMLNDLEVINRTLSNLSDNYLDNINLITALCGQLLNASSALYNRLNEGLLCSFGKWNTAPDHIPVVKPEGRICHDVIRQADNDIVFVENLNESVYASTDPNVLQFNLKSYLGHKVRCNGEPVGSLCVVFQHHFELTRHHRYIISRLALALEAEETSESLRKSKKRYSELFDFAVEGILTGSPKGIVTDVNTSLQKMTGFASSELLGKHISEILFTEQSRKCKPFRFDLLQQGLVVINERDILCKDNRIITVEMHSKMMPDFSFQTVLFDITSRKEAEIKLHLSENTYRGIINSLNDAIYILDQDGCFVDVNAAAEKLYGYEKEFFIGKTPEFLSAPGLNDLEMTLRHIQDAYNGHPVRFEFWGLRKDGSIFPKEVSLAPGMWFDKKVVIAAGREMTERKRVEESLRISEEKYRMLVQYSSDPIFSFNPDETYRFVNDAFATPFGKKPEQIIGKTPFDIFPPDEAEKRLRLVRKVFSTGEQGEIEVKVINVQQEEKYYLTMADPVKNEDGHILWVTCISKDITHRKKAEEELRIKNEQLNSMNAEKDKFFSIVAHDLRGPMNGFLGLTGIMADDIENLSADELREIATTMRSSAVNIYRLIENLLEWSKMQRGILSYEPQPLFLKSSLTKSIELMMDMAAKKGIDLQIKIPDHSVVYADIHMLETIIRNLVSNAIKFSFKGETVEIAAEKTEAKMIRIQVKDSGIGIPPDLADKLFKLTENTSRKGTEGESSTGLGLVLCKEFVEKQGGKIWVESQEGAGSCFIFTLPQS